MKWYAATALALGLSCAARYEIRGPQVLPRQSCGNYSPADLKPLLDDLLWDADRSIIPQALERPLSSEQLPPLVKTSLFYIGSALQLPTLHRPQIILIDEKDWKLPKWQGGIYDHETDQIYLKNNNAINVRRLILHELIHAQEKLEQPWENLFGPSPYRDESYVNALTLEALARQALDGDALAQFTFAYEARSFAEGAFAQERSGKPLEFIFQACQQSEHSFSGIQQLLNKGIALSKK